VIIVASIILAYKVYESEYFIKANEASIEKAVEEFLELDVTRLKYKKFQNVLIVYYESNNGNYDGSTVLYKGLNNRYQIRMAGYGTKNRVFLGRVFKSYGKRYLAVMGENYNKMIDRVVIETSSGIIKEFNFDGESYIIKAFKTDVEWDDLLSEYTLFNEKGKDITKQLNDIYYQNGGFGSGTGKAETFMLYVYCTMILVIGYFVSRIFLDNKKIERENT